MKMWDVNELKKKEKGEHEKDGKYKYHEKSERNFIHLNIEWKALSKLLSEHQELFYCLFVNPFAFMLYSNVKYAKGF